MQKAQGDHDSMAIALYVIGGLTIAGALTKCTQDMGSNPYRRPDELISFTIGFAGVVTGIVFIAMGKALEYLRRCAYSLALMAPGCKANSADAPMTGGSPVQSGRGKIIRTEDSWGVRIQFYEEGGVLVGDKYFDSVLDAREAGVLPSS